MTERDISPPVQAQEPTQEGWYRTIESGNVLLFARYRGQWYAHAIEGQVSRCAWSYIGQAGPVELVAAFPPKDANDAPDAQP